MIDLTHSEELVNEVQVLDRLLTKVKRKHEKTQVALGYSPKEGYYLIHLAPGTSLISPDALRSARFSKPHKSIRYLMDEMETSLGS